MNTRSPALSPLSYAALVALAATLLLAGLGCLKPSAPVIYHTLQGAPEGGPGRGPAVEVMAVHLPEVLQRPQIVLSLGPGSVELAAGHRWGNPLEKDLQRVLVADLGGLLGSGRVAAYPGGPAVGAAYRVEVDIIRCQGRPGGTLNFLATWMITRPGGVEAVVLASTRVLEPVAALTTEALVAAHEQAMARLSADIAGRLQGLP
jgi:hypothetical protein